MNEENMIDQTPIAEAVSEKIPYVFRNQFLVKPLEPVKVQKKITTPVGGDSPTTDEEGVTAIDYKEVKEEIKEVDSDWRRGIVLKVPFNYNNGSAVGQNGQQFKEMDINVGDMIIYKYGPFFDLVKDTQLVSLYDVVAVKKA